MKTKVYLVIEDWWTSGDGPNNDAQVFATRKEAQDYCETEMETFEQDWASRVDKSKSLNDDYGEYLRRDEYFDLWYRAQISEREITLTDVN